MSSAALTAAFAGACESVTDSFGMPVLHVRAADVLDVVTRLRNEFGFELLLDVTAIDYPQRLPRFDVVYHLRSRVRGERVRLKAQVPEAQPTVPTITTLFGSARYLEREVHEMYGIDFAGNADLRPILLYEGFVGHPLRKDYPMDREQPIVEYRKR
jgi:NADH-quinone oxidoreductase subunit C